MFNNGSKATKFVYKHTRQEEKNVKIIKSRTTDPDFVQQVTGTRDIMSLGLTDNT